ncbi:MAG TPA: TIGR01777 family oxidoreductase [Streptosporangiaceae bacterium]|nr:TIGR01777 family oxidoreductase [Streptosporangiaceae bacterium]
MKIAISGASGLIGSALAADLASTGHEVLRLVRSAPRSDGELAWDPMATAGGLDSAALSDVDAVVHLSGAPVADKRWTAARKAELRSSRITSTRALVAAIATADPSPSVLICGSAVGYYGETGDKIADESSPAGTGFLADLVRDWESAAEGAARSGTRVVNIRSGLVLAAGGGLLGRMLLPFKFGLGARIGPGTQYLSWISLTDEVRAIEFLLEAGDLEGPVNLTAPEPVTNAEFTQALAQALHRPALMRLPAAVLSGALGEVATELLGSARIVPTRLQDAGFTFRTPDLRTALASILAPTT